MRLSHFILANMDVILDKWAEFASTLVPEKRKFNREVLIDHARLMLETIAADLLIPESALEQIEKSMGHKLPGTEISAATMHGAAREESGFTLNATVSEYRALRASVTRLWEELPENQPMPPEAVVDLVRFNEAIDQALKDSVNSYYDEKEQKIRLFDAILSSTPDLSCIFDLEGRFTYANKVFLELLGMQLGDLVGKTYADCGMPNAAEKDRQVQQVIHTGQPVRGECCFAHRPGNGDLYEYILTPVYDRNGRMDGVAGTSRNVTDRKAAEIRNWKQANFDPLTGLPNRCLFHNRLEQEVLHATRSGGPIALLFVDLDKFKEANDKFGHEAGDLVLQYASARMRACVRESDTVARLGGDEFTIILQDLNENGHAENVARKILGQMQRPFHVRHQAIHISASIGIALAPFDADTPEELMRDADHAMYLSKEAGCNCFRFYSRPHHNHIP